MRAGSADRWWATVQIFFFFKRKTAYEFGLGIPAEPLFRSCGISTLSQSPMLDAVIHLLMEAKHWGLRKSRNATSLNSRFKSLDTLKVKIISVTFRRVIRDRKSVV